VRAGRLLLIINAVVMVLSSFTERLWTWDHFLRGGQDFELSLLALIAFFCLVLVLAEHFRRNVSDRFAEHTGHPVTRTHGAVPLSAPPLLLLPSSERPPGLYPDLSSSPYLNSCIVLRV
jgi:hypothetical protein